MHRQFFQSLFPYPPHPVSVSPSDPHPAGNYREKVHCVGKPVHVEGSLCCGCGEGLDGWAGAVLRRGSKRVHGFHRYINVPFKFVACPSHRLTQFLPLLYPHFRLTCCLLLCCCCDAVEFETLGDFHPACYRCTVCDEPLAGE